MRFPAEAGAAVLALHRALETVEIALRLNAGDLLVLDNHRVAHGRTAFATGESASRHLMRMYAVERPAQPLRA